METLEERRLLTITVDTPLDVVNTGDGLTSLREAITDANNVAGPETIDFAAELSGATINLTGGELEITDDLTIDASALPSNVTLDAQQASRVLNFSTLTGDLALNSLTITGGQTTGDNTYPGNQTGYTPNYIGGGIRFLSDGTLTITDSTVTSNGTTGLGASGGGIATREGTIMLIDSVVSGNTTTGNWGRGGGVYSRSGEVTIEGTTVAGNTTSASGGSGGGIFTLSSDVSLNESQLTNNKTLFTGPLAAGRFNNGGGISTLQGDVNITDSTVTGNSTAGNSSSGGAIIASDGNVTVVASHFSNNLTTGSNSAGGAIRAGSNPFDYISVVIRQGSTFENNSDGTLGGAVSVSGGSISVEDSTLIGNESTSGSGGALGLARGEITITNSELRANHSPGGGGAIHVNDGSITLTDSTVTENYTTSSGLFSSGGAVFIRMGEGSVNLLRTSLSNNEARGSSAGGGGIFVLEDVDVNITQSTVNNNRSLQAGGGGISIREGDLTISESTVSGNSAVIRGGGIHAVAYGAVTITDSTISGNTVTGSDAIGGGLYSRGGVVDITLSTISGNRTTTDGSSAGGNTVPDSQGAGIALGLGSLILNSSTLTDNHAEGLKSTGGGIRIINSTAAIPAIITNSIVAGNTGSSVPFRPSPDFAYSVSPDETILVESSLIGEIDSSLLDDLTATNSSIGVLGSPIDAGLGPLADNGGPTLPNGAAIQTHALLPGSAALDALTVAPLYDYRFDTLEDSQASGPDLITLGGDGTLSGGIYTLGTNQGIETRIPAANENDYAVELYFKFDTLNASTGYQKIIDFGTPTHPEAGLYVFSTGTVNRLRYLAADNGSFFTGPTELASDTWYHLVVTRDDSASSPLASFLDGQFERSYPSVADGGTHAVGRFSDEADLGSTRRVQILHSDTSLGSHQGGAIDRLRVFDRPLTAGEISNLFDAGPNLELPNVDQRGLPRLTGTAIDIGAYEAQITPSADFDSDGDVDGADFLIWQRGLGAMEAIRADGNSDDDDDVDASDLTAWEVSYAQPQLLAAMTTSEPFAALENPATKAQTPAAWIDAAMALAGRGNDFPESPAEVRLSVPLESSRWVRESPNEQAAATRLATSDEPLAVEASERISVHDPWLDEELVGRVFG